MCLYDRLADGQADAHVAPLVGDLLLIAGQIAVKQVRQQFLCDPLPVVRDGEYGERAVLFQAEVDLCRRFAVLDGIFHEVDQHLLDEDDIHGDHQQLLRR